MRPLEDNPEMIVAMERTKPFPSTDRVTTCGSKVESWTSFRVINRDAIALVILKKTPNTRKVNPTISHTVHGVVEELGDGLTHAVPNEEQPPL